MTSSNALHLAVTAGGAAAGALALHTVVYFLLGRAAPRLSTAGVVVRRTRRSSRVVALIVALATAWSATGPRLRWSGAVSHGFEVAQIAAVAWLAVEAILAVEDISFHRYDVSIANNLRARKLRTQILVLRRVTVAVVAILAAAGVLLTFRSIRVAGTSLLASAGIAGIVAATAARPVLGNLLSGVQLAFTEPIRLDDVLVVEGNFGWVEEITLSYVVLRCWDRRRLVLPVSYFTSTPFENWTRNSADLLGSVYLYLDYTAPVEEMRERLQEIVAASDLWDGNTAVLQVTDATERSIQVRVLVSAANSAATFDLRCYVREQLVSWVSSAHPDALPTDRFIGGPDPRREAGGSARERPELGAPRSGDHDPDGSRRQPHHRREIARAGRG